MHDYSLLQSARPVFQNMDSILKMIHILPALEAALSNRTDFTSLSIRSWISSGQPLRVVFETIKSQASNNRAPLDEIFGENLLNEIISAV